MLQSNYPGVTVRNIRFRLCFCSASAAFVLLAGVGVTAQEAPAVPGELVSALLSDGAAGDLRPGVLPDEFPPEAILPDAVVVGSHAFPRRATVVLAVAGSTDVALSALEARLAASGWKPEPRTPRHGFVSLTSGFGSGFCRDDAYLAPSYIPRTGGGTLVRVYWDRDDAGRCSAARLSMPHDDAPLPRLIAPGRARFLGGGGGGDSSTSETHTRLASDMTVAELTSHYGEQLRRAGWIASHESSGDLSSLRIYTFAGRDNRSWWGILNVIALPDTNLRFVHLRMGPIDNGGQ